MTIIYQWKLERLIGTIIELRKKEVKAKERWKERGGFVAI